MNIVSFFLLIIGMLLSVMMLCLGIECYFISESKGLHFAGLCLMTAGVITGHLILKSICYG